MIEEIRRAYSKLENRDSLPKIDEIDEKEVVLHEPTDINIDDYKQRKFIIDGLSFLFPFFDFVGNAWDIDLLYARVKVFCKLFKIQNIKMKVFIDGEKGTEGDKELYMKK